MKNYFRWRWLVASWLLLTGLIACAVEEQQAAAPTGSSENPPVEPARPTVTLARPTAALARPTPTLVPVGGAPAQPSQPPATGLTPVPLATAGVTPVPPPTTGVQTVRLEDDAWQGSYRRAGGTTVYGGRTATWIYGNGTQYSAMQTQFDIARQPTGTAELRVEGMDSEGSAKTAIRITINGQPIFEGANPLPDDDQPLATGTWATARWSFSAALLRPGANVVEVVNLSPGQFSRPPFFMLDYAEISYATP